MSLINEALKRAEAEKLNREGITTAPPPPPLPKAPTTAKGRAVVAILTVVMIATAVAGGVNLLRRFSSVPKAGIAASSPQVAPSAPAANPRQQTVEPALAAAVSTAKVTVAKAQARQAQVAQEAAQAGAEEDLAPAEDSPAAKSDKAAVTEPAVAALEGTAPQDGSSTGSPPQPGNFRLSGIMSGPNGEAALINGQMVEVGATIDGAKLVKVLNQAVELRIGDRQFTVRM